jgi:hypothetical protein
MKATHLGLILWILAPSGLGLGAAELHSSQGFGVAPLRCLVKSAAGRRAETNFVIATRNTRDPTRFSLTVKDLGQANVSSVVPVSTGGGARSCSGWISIPGEVTVGPESRERVTFVVDVPSGARGAYYCFVVVELIPALPAATFSAVLKPSLAVEVEVVVPGPAPLYVDVSEVQIEASGPGHTPVVRFLASNRGVWKTTVQGDVLLYASSATWPIRAPIPERAPGRLLEIYPGVAVRIECRPVRAVAPGRYSGLVRILLNGQARARSRFEVEVPADVSGSGVRAKIVEKAELAIPLAVQPSLVEVGTPPGARRSIPIRVTNQGDRDATVTVGVSDVRIEADGMVTFPDALAQDEAQSITVAPEQFTVRSGGVAVIRATVSVPRRSGPPASTMKAVRLSVSPLAGLSDQAPSEAGEFNVLVVAEDPSLPPPTLETIDFRALRSGPERPPAAAMLRLKNAGGKVAKATGRITLERASGQEIAHMDIGAAQPELILPGGEREFRMPIPPLDKGKFRIRAEISPGPGGGQKAVAVEEFETYVDIPEGLRDAVETPPATEPGESDTGTEKKPETPPAPDPSREGDFRP